MVEPSKSKKPQWPAALTPVVMALAGAAVGFLLAKAGMAFLPSSPSLKTLTPWDLLALPVIIVFVLAFHEAGHLAGGMSRGMRFLLFIAGPFGWVRGKDGVRFRWFFNLGTLGGLAAALPVPGLPLKPQLTRLVVGGPLASLVLATAALAVFWWFPGRPGAYALMTAGISLAIFVVTAVPLRSGGFMSDGMQLLQLQRNPAHIERRVNLMALMGLSMGGTRPRELDPELLTLAQSRTGNEPLADVGVWLYSYANALDKGNVPDAEAWLQRIADVYESYPDGFRQSLAVELSLFEALHRGHLDAALAWQGKARGGIVDASRRHLAQAAIALLEDNRAEAARALTLAEKHLGQALDPGFARLSADQLDAMKHSLENAATPRQAA